MCRMMASGPTLLDPSTAVRAQVCVDAANCISEDAKGNCQGGYGYCTREANTWKIDADACESEYASCQSLSTPSGQRVAYNLNTVRAGICNADNAGCRAYSNVQNAVPNGGFEDVISGRIRDWSMIGSSGTIGLDSTGQNSYHGNGAAWVSNDSSLLETSVSTTATATGNIYDSVVKLIPGQSYQLSFSSRASQVNPNTRAVMQVTLTDEDGHDAAGLCRKTQVNGLAKSCKQRF